ncbi:MAG: PRD domain-containing protein [Erysipelotrichaceae bacterium]|nr:PRD domain-containing protein [Erysipelotrichaceae bacterium]
MKLKKALNSNSLIAADEKGNEYIVLGRGIGFGKKKGDQIDEGSIERVFASDKNTNAKLLELIRSIPEEYFILAGEIIECAEHRLNKKLNDSIYFTLTDHICFITKRLEKGIMPSNPLKWEIQRYYSLEYDIARKAKELLEDEFDYVLNDDETATLAMHIVNAEEDVDMHQNMESIRLMKEIMKIIKLLAQVEINEDSLNYQRLITHLRFFVYRMNAKKQESKNEPLYEIIKTNYAKAFSITERICELLKKKNGYIVTNQEQTYLTIHIQRVIEREN